MFRRSRHRSKHFLKASPDVEGKTNLYIVSNPDDNFLQGPLKVQELAKLEKIKSKWNKLRKKSLTGSVGSPELRPKWEKVLKKVWFGLPSCISNLNI